MKQWNPALWEVVHGGNKFFYFFELVQMWVTYLFTELDNLSVKDLNLKVCTLLYSDMDEIIWMKNTFNKNQWQLQLKSSAKYSATW